MPSVAYQVIRRELTPAQNGVQLVAPQNGISSLTVLELPAGSDAGIRLSQSGDRIAPLREGFVFDDLCPLANDGLYLDIPTAAPGNFITLVVFFGSGEVQGAN